MMVPPIQASSGLELKALLHKSTCTASFCKAIPFLHWTHLKTTPWSVECKAFPQWVLTAKVSLSPRLKGAVTSQRDIIHEEYEWAASYPLPVWPAETGISCGDGYYFVQLSSTLGQERAFAFPHQVSQEEDLVGKWKTINCFETYFWKGIKWKEFPNLSWMEH